MGQQPNTMDEPGGPEESAADVTEKAKDTQQNNQNPDPDFKPPVVPGDTKKSAGH